LTQSVIIVLKSSGWCDHAQVAGFWKDLELAFW